MVENGQILFNDFQVISQLSQKDSEAVFFCQEAACPDQYLVIKAFDINAPEHAARAESIAMEINASYRISHPNVLKSFEFLQDQAFFGFTMEYVNGCTLGERLSAVGQLQITQAIEIINQLAAGLEAIHIAGIMHRDLKPCNVMIDTENNVKICDFGVAISAEDESISRTESIVGTVDYLSPEYLQTGRFDKQSDIYAFGVMAYELISGKPPFVHLDPVEAMIARATQDPIPLHEIRPDCPRQLSDTIMRALSRNTKERFQSATVLKSNLEPLKEWIEFYQSRFDRQEQDQTTPLRSP